MEICMGFHIHTCQCPGVITNVDWWIREGVRGLREIGLCVKEGEGRVKICKGRNDGEKEKRGGRGEGEGMWARQGESTVPLHLFARVFNSHLKRR